MSIGKKKLFNFTAFIILIFSLLITGCSDENSIPDGMKVYTNKYFNISTAIPEDWRPVYSPDIGHNTLMYTVGEINKETESHIQVVKFDKDSNYLQKLYEKNETYEEFIHAFVERIEKDFSTTVKTIDTVKNKPILAHTITSEVHAFFVLEIGETPLLFMISVRSEHPEVEMLKQHETYEQFIKMIKHTKPWEQRNAE